MHKGLCLFQLQDMWAMVLEAAHHFWDFLFERLSCCTLTWPLCTSCALFLFLPLLQPLKVLKF